jgi:hypothetical protein
VRVKVEGRRVVVERVQFVTPCSHLVFAPRLLTMVMVAVSPALTRNTGPICIEVCVGLPSSTLKPRRCWVIAKPSGV